MTETPDSPQEPGLQTLGRYEIRAVLGRGGFATVYRALDPNLDREVALKVLHPQLLVDRSFVARFRKEARSMANLRHPHIITVFEVSEADGRLFIAMELAHGSLAQVIKARGRIPWAEVLDILRPVCTALDYAHSQGIVHRDIKPCNILLNQERGPLLTDFGLARIMGDNSMSISMSGGVVGTPAYIAPEVWEEEAAWPAADIYALGCVCYEMVTGALLFNGATPMHIMRAHDKGPQFAAWPEGTPPGLDAALRIALAREPGARYPSSEAFWHALNDAEANAQAAREQAEREAVAAQWQAEVEQAIAEGEWSIAKKAVGRWLKITPESAAAQAARRRIEVLEAREQEEARRKKQEEEESARQAREREAARVAVERKAQTEAAARATAHQTQTVQTEPKPVAKRQLPIGKLIAGGLSGIVLIALIILGINQIGERMPVPSITDTPTSTPRSIVTDTPTTTSTPQPTATLVPPTPIPTPAPSVERILFERGATQTTIRGDLPANSTKVYVMGVSAGQFIEMSATVNAMGQGLRFAIVGADGTVVRAMGEAYVHAVVPRTQDYYVELVSDVGAVNYEMSVLIPVRIRFSPGATSAEVAGSLAANGMRHYVFRALAGQRMIVVSRASKGQVGLVISGADGQVLLSGHVASDGYDGILPTTQDYLITVWELGETSADYILEITIPPL